MAAAAAVSAHADGRPGRDSSGGELTRTEDPAATPAAVSSRGRKTPSRNESPGTQSGVSLDTDTTALRNAFVKEGQNISLYWYY